MATLRFNGQDYVPTRDGKRLTIQYQRIFDLMRDGLWRTLGGIEATTSDPPASISAQLRHMRKERFGAHTILKRYTGDGLYEYRLVVNAGIAYKLFRRRKDGSLGPLFINCRQRIPVGEWLHAECHPRKGYAVRPGWHCTLAPVAPHLSTNGRVWCRVQVLDCRIYDRPESQGGKWVLAQRMRVLHDAS